MFRILLALVAPLTLMMVGSAAEERRPNILLICVDDLRPELKCFGVDYIHSPHIDGLAQRGRIFRRHYVQAPTCGASRYTLLTGRYFPAGNNALFQRAKQLQQNPASVPPSMPAWFRQHGYTTVSVGKVSHHPGGRGGANWDDDNIPEMPNSWDRHLLPAGPWKHPRGWMHGLAHGEIRTNASQMDVFQAMPGPDSIYPDGVAIPEAIRQLELLHSDPSKPFFLAVGILRPHLPFGAPAQYRKLYDHVRLPAVPHPQKPESRTTWHRSGEFMKYNRWGRDPNSDPDFATEVRKHYAACVSYADASVGRVLGKLKELGADDHTIVVLWGDHGWHLGEHAVWGKHTLFEESLRSPLIILHPGMSKPGAATEAIVETLDVFPTLCDLTGVPAPEFTHGQSLRPLLSDPAAEAEHPAVAYSRSVRSIRNDRFRMNLHGDGFVELYDHRSAAGETENVAPQHPNVVQNLTQVLQSRLNLP